ncbi:cysteine--tRNA ligase [Rickettsiales bacterium]|nr:cysteine--tRNA ligase [Rickettsiales bacterium]
MDLFLYNTLSRTKEKFVPIEQGLPRIYVCGPTVYSYAHLGNARSVVVYDVLYRLLQKLYKKVMYVRNITDVDDKIIAAAKLAGRSVADITTFYANAFHADMRALYCLEPNIQPLATEHIQEMIAIISELATKGHVYEVDGEMYFDIRSYAAYGKLSGCNLDQIEAGARVDVKESKRHPADFVLWKRASDEDDKILWDSPWGPGRPSWHIECTAMSMKYLGPDFDIHGGGVDLQFPHHENEIACCAANDCQFVRYWVHSGFLTVGGEKMSKSLGNIITVNDLLKAGVPREAIRYALLMTHYHKPLDWNDEFLLNAKKSLNKLYGAILFTEKNSSKPEQAEAQANINTEFLSALMDDMNTPRALSALHSLAGQMNRCEDLQKKSMLAGELRSAAKFLGLLNLSASDWYTKDPDAEVELLIQERHEARRQKNYTLADSIRAKLKQKGILLKDNPDGITDWYYEV